MKFSSECGFCVYSGGITNLTKAGFFLEISLSPLLLVSFFHVYLTSCFLNIPRLSVPPTAANLYVFGQIIWPLFQ